MYVHFQKRKMIKQFNNKVERYQEIDSPLDNLLIFARGGFITPLVHLMEFTDEYLENLRTKPIELIIALDDNYESQGKLYIDDGESADSSYYKMDFVSLYDDKNQQLEISLSSCSLQAQ